MDKCAKVLEDKPPLTAASAEKQGGNQVMAQGGTPTSLHVDDEAIYVVDPHPGAVFKLSKDGATMEEVWRPKKGKARVVLGDDDSLFVVAWEPGKLVRIDKKSGTVHVIREKELGFLELDPGPTNQGMLYVGVDTLRGPLQRHYDRDSIAPRDGAFVSPDKVSSIPHGPKSAATIGGNMAGYVLELAIDRDHLFYTGREPGLSSLSPPFQLYRRSRSGGDPEIIGEGCNRIALSEAHVYCARGKHWDSPNQVFKLTKEGKGSKLVFRTEGKIQSIHIDGKDAYVWSFSGVAQHWNVWKIVDADPEGRLIAVEDHLIGSVATDATHVYWTNRGATNQSGETLLAAGAVRRQKR
ncbi:MAG: hypothetical protein DRI90_01250 [Deltaproteobacteria bacterium]|nr:MAG: hypothetical protein DRI90_01250 [Deltaproteobacteria bacterium]